ncbi:MAG: hypothetical protein ACYC9M_04890 [Desulfobulbaceae bacterium]
MNEERERDAFVLAGQVAAEIDNNGSLQGDQSMRQRLISGLIEGTSDSDAFLEGYTHKFAQSRLSQLNKS